MVFWAHFIQCLLERPLSPRAKLLTSSSPSPSFSYPYLFSSPWTLPFSAYVYLQDFCHLQSLFIGSKNIPDNYFFRVSTITSLGIPSCIGSTNTWWLIYMGNHIQHLISRSLGQVSLYPCLEDVLSYLFLAHTVFCFWVLLSFDSRFSLNLLRCKSTMECS